MSVQLFHDFCHFSDISFVAHGSSSEAGDFSAVTVRERPFFAAESAFHFQECRHDLSKGRCRADKP